MDGLAKLVAGAKTPLALAGVAFFILYGIIKIILGMNVFSVIDAQQTATFLMFVVRSLFWLAVLTLCLGMIGWVLQLNPRYRPSVKVESLEIIPPRSDDTIGRH